MRSSEKNCKDFATTTLFLSRFYPSTPFFHFPKIFLWIEIHPLDEKKEGVGALFVETVDVLFKLTFPVCRLVFVNDPFRCETIEVPLHVV